mgnify:CR=1 FL=1
MSDEGRYQELQRELEQLAEGRREELEHSDVLLLSLDGLTETLTNYIANRAAMIYYYHNLKIFMYFKSTDRILYQGEIRNLKRNIRDGKISSISTGDTLSINGTDLFPMELKIAGCLCYENFLLSRQGNYKDAENTPYFFRSQEKRDQIMTYLMRYMPSISEENS